MINEFKKYFSNKIFIIVFLLFLVFYIKAIIFVDPDFGWRIRAGEYYWNNGMPETDIFTYTMPNFPWVDHAWGVSLIFYLLNNFFGYSVLGFLMCLLVMFTVLVLYKTVYRFDFGDLKSKNLTFSIYSKYLSGGLFKLDLNKIFPFSFFPLILVISIFLPFFGIRAQIVSWFMFSILIFWLSDIKVFQKNKRFLPAFFFLWANLHGSFALGVFVLLLYLFIKTVDTHKFFSKDNFIGTFSFLATFINPYGIGVWREAWSSASDPRLRWSISEWMPALTMFDLAMVFLICLSIIFIWKYRKRYSTFELVLYLFLFVQAISSRRQLPLWAIFSFPLITRGILFFRNDLVKIENARSRFIKVYRVALVVSVFIFIFQSFLSIKDAYSISPDKFYPVSAVAYLKRNLPEGEIFSEYGWGGYLIWKLPVKRVFIDGRMPSWRWNPKNEVDLPSAFDTYNELLKGEVEYEEIFVKYNIDTILVQKGIDFDNSSFLNKAKNVLSIFGWEKNDFSLIEAVENDGWEKVYEDEIAVIYAKH